MAKLVLVFLLVIATNLGDKGTEAHSRIIGGESAVIGQFPYLVSIRYGGSHTCGGSILDETTILSAAHCVEGRLIDYFTVIPGVVTLSENGIAYQVSKINKHQDYVPDLVHNDISILKLALPIQYSNVVQPINLTPHDTDGGEEVVLSGWGREHYPGPISDSLQFIELVTITLPECRIRQTGFPIFDNQLCTFTNNGQGACHGDSGGPLVDIDHSHQVGILSWGTPCGVGDPDVYTNVYFFLDWIAENRN